MPHPLDVSPGRPLRLGLLGAAQIAPKAAILPARRRADVEIAAVAARDPARAAEFAAEHGIARALPTYEALVGDPELDAVYNALPNHAHGLWSIRALEAGKHVLCEKPVACNADEARAMVETARAADRLLVEAFHYPYHPLTERWRQLLRDGAIGEIRRLCAMFRASIPETDIRYDYSLAGGALMDLGCYCIHLVRLAAGQEPTVERARATEGPPHVDVEFEADLRFPGGASAEIICAMNLDRGKAQRRYEASLTIEGTHGRLEVDSPTLPHLRNHLRVRGRVDRDEVVPGQTTYDYQLEAFVDALRTGRPPLTSGEDMLGNMRVIDAAYVAAGLPLRGASEASG